jgi:hypothetical protein
MDSGESLRWGMFMATATVMALGTWFAYEAAKTSEADAQKTMGEFLATYQARTAAES